MCLLKMKRILDATFRYRPSFETDIRKTFQRVRREQREARREERESREANVRVLRVPKGGG